MYQMMMPLEEEEEEEVETKVRHDRPTCVVTVFCPEKEHQNWGEIACNAMAIVEFCTKISSRVKVTRPTLWFIVCSKWKTTVIYFFNFVCT